MDNTTTLALGHSAWNRLNKSEKVTTTLIREIDSAKNFKSLDAIFRSGKFRAHNPKTIRRQMRALNKKLKSLRVKSRIPSYLFP